MRYVIPFLLLAGCATSQRESFILPTGEAIGCLQYEQQKCGMALRSCGDAASVDFECVSGVMYVGPTETVTAKIEAEVKAEKSPTFPPDYYVLPEDQEVSK